MPTPLLSNEAFDLVNESYNNAVKARQMGVYLDTQPNDAKAAQQWHLIADSLFEAVALYDKTVTQGAKLPSQCTKQKTIKGINTMSNIQSIILCVLIGALWGVLLALGV